MRTILTLCVLLYGSHSPHLAPILVPRHLGTIGSVSPYLGSFMGGNKSAWVRSYLQASKFSTIPRRERATVGSKKQHAGPVNYRAIEATVTARGVV